jgi:hypothetical protein
MVARAIHRDALARTRTIAIDSAIATGITIDGLRATATNKPVGQENQFRV